MKKGGVIFFSVFFTLQMQAQNITNKEDRVDSTNNVHLEIFSEIPDEIDGCSCYFSISQEDFKNEKYIYVNDFAAIAFVKMNGEWVRFELENHDEKRNIYFYFHGEDKMKVEITKKTSNDYEEVEMEGIITIESQKRRIKQDFIGKCGC